MAQSGTQTIAMFTGTLLRRQHTIGERFVQLVFREGDKDWLCISSNAMLTKLDVGQQYRIQGIFKTRHGYNYVHEPRVTPAYPRFFRLKRWAVRVAVVLVVATATAFAVRLVHGNLVPTSAEATRTPHKPAAQTASVPATTQQPTVPAPTADTPSAPAPVASAAAAKPKTTTAKTSTTPIAVPLSPHCDAVIVTTLAPVVNSDPAQPATYELVTQQNIDRQVQTCYPDTGTANGTTTMLVAGQPLIKTVGTMAPDPDPQPGS